MNPGRVLWKCRRCGNHFEAQDCDAEDFINIAISGHGKLFIAHECRPGHFGIADLIGASEKEKET